MRSLIRLVLLSCALVAGLSLSAAASSSPTPEQVAAIDKMVDTLGRAAHGALANAKLSDGTLIGAGKAKTLVYPLVPTDVMKVVVARGSLAGVAKVCGLDWQKEVFMPTMMALRKKFPDYTDYQFAFIGVLHGMTMGKAEEAQKIKTCDDATKQKLSDALKKPKQP